jgi:hypothetical protein
MNLWISVNEPRLMGEGFFGSIQLLMPVPSSEASDAQGNNFEATWECLDALSHSRSTAVICRSFASRSESWRRIPRHCALVKKRRPPPRRPGEPQPLSRAVGGLGDCLAMERE